MAKISTTAIIEAIRMEEQGSAPSTPAAGYSTVFAKSDGLYIVDDDGTVTGPFATSTGAAASGWISAAEGWAYVSVDDPSGVIDATGDVRSSYSAGMRIKMTNGGNTIYGIITDVNGTLQSGNTRITFLHEIDPSDSQAKYLMANSAITNPYYSTSKAPQAFPLSPTKWQVIYTDTSLRTQATPAQNTWYNINTATISVPIGEWRLEYKCVAQSNDSGTGTWVIQTTLSTANDSASDDQFTTYWSMAPAGGYTGHIANQFIGKYISLAAKASYYLNTRTTAADLDNLYNRGDLGTTVIRAICAYL